ncbi:DUF6087 family protein [Streptomyces sp. NPDC087212]|uniref:DUF6087 family protein n=1 Tax=Streptomyces sp. NPDC087212 TaxID=3365766 RepID=UPI00380D0379
MDDEPLSEWAKRRDAKVGRLRAVHLTAGEGDPRGFHVNPDAPRIIQRWNGHLWEPYAFASDLAEAKRVLYATDETEAADPPASGPAPRLGTGTGRHRKPRPPRPDPR